MKKDKSPYDKSLSVFEQCKINDASTLAYLSPDADWTVLNLAKCSDEY